MRLIIFILILLIINGCGITRNTELDKEQQSTAGNSNFSTALIQNLKGDPLAGCYIVITSGNVSSSVSGTNGLVVFDNSVTPDNATYNIQVFSVASTKNYALEEIYFYSTYNTISVYVDYASI